MSRAKQQPKTSKPNRRRPVSIGRRLRLPLLVLLVAGAGAFWHYSREQPRRLLKEAREVLDGDPYRAAELAELSVDAAGGNYPDGHLLWARALGKSGRWIEALGCFGLIETPTACDQRELIDFAQAAQQAGQQHLARLALEAANRPGPDQADALRLLIPIKHGLRLTSDCLAHAADLAQLAPDDPLPWGIRAAVYHESGQFAQAVAASREALQRASVEADLDEIRGRLVDLLIDLGDVEAARREIDALLAGKPPSDTLLLKHAHLLRLERKLDEAVDVVDRVLAKDAKSAPAQMLRGVLHFDRGEHGPAVEFLERVVTANPHNKEAHYKLGRCYLTLGQPEKAQPHFETSRRLTEASVRILELRSAIDGEPKNRELRLELAELFQQLGQSAAAEQWRRSAQALP